ncbi:hypothetical protein Tcan_05859 [Toxocara canis]|uniref:Uncharacterized protein n=1 Tax=Toxocara canis TaxID=6265 RepID=A0A0B2VGQ7_TOXCA|nr:hypothetical protein Tcan_05859 [Toxocara canis]
MFTVRFQFGEEKRRAEEASFEANLLMNTLRRKLFTDYDSSFPLINKNSDSSKTTETILVRSVASLRCQISHIRASVAITELHIFARRIITKHSVDFGRPEPSAVTTVATANGTIAFSWWAIQVSEPSWRLLKSGMPGMQILERSIERRCMSAGSRGLYGFSFTNVTTDRAYMDFDLDNATVTDNDLQEIVVDVFYFCCLPQRGCGEFPSSDEEEDILLHLANKTASIVLRTPGIHAKPNSSSISGRYSDEQVPFHVAYVFLADANAEVKVFSGPLMFSQFDQTDQRSERRTNSIADLVRQGNFCSNDGQNDGEGLADGECIKYLSIKEYFLYCCCYENVSQCAYTADQEKFSYAQRNARNWRLNPNLRGFSKSSHSGDMHFVKHTARDVTFGWTYRDFIYSKPRKRTKYKYFSVSSNYIRRSG